MDDGTVTSASATNMKTESLTVHNYTSCASMLAEMNMTAQSQMENYTLHVFIYVGNYFIVNPYAI
jgi:hypothetical protein